MRSRGLLPATVAVALVCGAAACAKAPAGTRSRVKIPITTSSEEARKAYLEGRDLLEGLRLTDANRLFLTATELDPGFALAWMAVANTSTTAREFFAALRNASAAAGGASDGEQMLIGAFEAGVNADPDTQRAQLQSLVASYPGDERAHNTLANFLFGQQDYEAAIAEYSQAIAIDPDFSQPYNQLGYSLRFLGEYEAAERAFKKYIELVPDQPNPYDSYAELLMQMGKYEESIATYEKALSIEPTFIASYIGIANNFLFMDRPDEARAALSRIEGIARRSGELRQMHTWNAASYLHQGNFDAALAEIRLRFDLAAQTDDRPAMSGDLNLMGNILLRAGRLDQATQMFDESVEMMESSDATDDIKEASRRNHVADVARIALARGDLKVAAELVASYSAAVAGHNVRPEVQQAHELTGMLELANGQPHAALFELANANQQNPQVLLLNAHAFAAAGDREAARAACREVVEFNQPNFNLAFVRGIAREMAGTL